MRIPQRSSKAFTLVELIVVIVILGLLALIAIPTFGKVTKKSQDASTSATLSAVLRDARALRALEPSSADDWKTVTEAAVGETNVPGSSAFMTATDQSAGEPTDSVAVYSLLSDGVVVSMRSKSGNVCVASASLGGATVPTCVPAYTNASGKSTAGSAASGTALSDGTTLPLAPGASKPGSSTPTASTPSAPPTASVASIAGGGRVTWTASVANGSPVTGYVITATPASGPVVTKSAAVTATTIDITLAAGVSYQVTVKATSSAGDSAATAAGTVTPKASYDATVLADSPSAYFKLDDASSSSAADSSGNGKNAAPVSVESASAGVITAKGAGLVSDGGTSFTFPASTSTSLGVPAISLNTGSGQTNTFEAWADFGANLDGRMLGSIGESYDLFAVGGCFGFNSGNGDLYGFQLNTISTGRHHVVAVFTNGGYATNKIYIDGVSMPLAQCLGTVRSATTFATGSNARIGGWSYSYAASWGYRIDNAAYYPGTLSPARVTAHYDAGR